MDAQKTPWQFICNRLVRGAALSVKAALIALSIGAAAIPPSAISAPREPLGISEATSIPLFNGDGLVLNREERRVYVNKEAGGQAELAGLAGVIGYTATVLTDGQVLLFGGRTPSGELGDSHVYDPNDSSLTRLVPIVLSRESHSATLLTDGRVLVTGGKDASGRALRESLILDFSAGLSVLKVDLAEARFGHTAQLMANGSVLILGGVDSRSMPVFRHEIFEPSFNAYRMISEAERAREASRAQDAPAVAEMRPAPGSQDVAVDETLAIRFNASVQASELAQGLVLLGPNGVVPSRIVPAEGGMLAFVTADAHLLPATRYELYIQGIHSQGGKKLPFYVGSFTTARVNVQAPSPAQASTPVVPLQLVQDPAKLHPLEHLRWNIDIHPQVGHDEYWIPGHDHIGTQKWNDTRGTSKIARGSPPVAPAGVTALSGRVLRLNGKALSGVSVQIGNVKTTTDASGSFLLAYLAPGFNVLDVNGASAPEAEGKYGRHQIRVQVREGVTNELEFDIWMTKLDPRGTFKLSSPTVQEVVLSTPSIPGLEVRIPAGAVLRDLEGRIVTEVNITAIPINKPPFPLPDPNVPVFFTVQPGGTWIETVGERASRGAQIYYPNYEKLFAGTIVPFFTYDPRDKDWYVYGEGRISGDGRQAVPDEGTVIYEFTGAMFNSGPNAPPKGPNPPNSNPKRLGDGLGPQGPKRGPGTGPRNGPRNGPGSGPGNGPGNGPGPGDGPGGPGGPGNGPGNGPGDGPGDGPGGPNGPGGPGGGPGPTGPDGPGAPDSGHGPDTAGGDPVSLATGYLFLTERDLFIDDVVAIDLTRTYRSQDTSQRTFGVGWASPYDTILHSQQQFQEVDVILPSGGRAHFVRISSGTSYTDAVFESTAPGIWYKSRIYRNNDRAGWDLIFHDGTKWFFPQYQPVKEMVDNNGNTTTIIRRDSNGLAGPIKRINSPNGRYVDFSLDSSGRVTQAVDNIGRTVVYAYDASGRLSTVTNPTSGVRTYTYDTSHRLVTVKDAKNVVNLTNQYDSNGRVTLQTMSDSTTIGFAYTLSSGKVTQTDVTDQRSLVRRVQFDSNGYMTSSTSAYGTADAQQASYTLDSNGQILSETDPLGRVTAYTYDGFGNLASATWLSGTGNAATTTYAYSPGGERLVSITNPIGKTVTYGYDAKWNLISVTDPLNHATSFTYDGQGRRTTRQDALSHTWTYNYAGPDMISITDPLDRTVTFMRDGVGRIVGVRDPQGRTSLVEYDAMDRVTKVKDYLQREITYGYDALSNMTSYLDERGNSTGMTYSDFSSISTRTDALTKAESFLFSPNGGVSRKTDKKGQVSGITYDNLNRVASVGFGATTGNPTNYTSTVTFTYDAGNRLTQLVDSIAGTITQSYDGLNRLTQAQSPEGTVSYTYDLAGRRAGMTVTGQSAVNYTWDDANRLTQVTQATDVVTIAYDNANRRSTLTLANGVVVTYAYNNANQLTSMTFAKSGTTLGDLTYSYDPSGRRTGVGGSLASIDLPAATTSMTVNAHNQLTAIGAQSLTYDDNGNLTSDGSLSFTWDERDRLASISGSSAATYGYDGFGRRRTKTVGSVTTKYLYDGLNVIQEITGSTVTANMLVLGLDELIWRKETAVTHHPLQDALGSVIALTDASGAIVTSYSFEPFGKASLTGTASSNPYTFTGREDDGSGLVYLRSRYMHTGIGRFISADPYGLLGGGTNLYEYGRSNPVVLRDPLGLDPLAFLGFHPITVPASVTGFDALFYAAGEMEHMALGAALRLTGVGLVGLAGYGLGSLINEYGLTNEDGTLGTRLHDWWNQGRDAGGPPAAADWDGNRNRLRLK